MLSFQSMDSQIKRDRLISAIKKTINHESPARWIKRAVSFEPANRSALICGREFGLDAGKLFISGFGKCAGTMAEGISEIFGGDIEKGLLISYKDKKIGRDIRIMAASHPLPGAATVSASRKLAALHLSMEENDTVLCLISGGGSSFFEIPAGAIELSELIKTNSLLLSSGAPISDINVVRKALSEVKGGKLLGMTKARVVTLAISDVIGGGPGDIASGPTWPQIVKPSSALEILKKYNILHLCPGSVIGHLKAEAEDRPENRSGTGAGAAPGYFVIGDNSKMLEAVSLAFSELGYDVEGSGRQLTGPAEKEAAWFMEKLLKLAGTVTRKTCLIAGGEITVKVSGKKAGGRCQHFALLCAGMLSEFENKGGPEISVAAFASDGVDGFTDAAGAFIENGTALKIGPEIISGYASNFASHDFFEKYGGLISTGPTGHNVNDFFIGFIN